MILTLYKNCIIRDSYAEVFDPSVFENYLNTLQSEYINLDSSYPTLYGRFQLDFVALSSPFEFNYMKLEAEDRTYYCFINDIDIIGNNLANISYAVDIWHTYMGGMNLRNSVLGNTKYLEGNFGFLPVEYETVEPITALSGLNAPIQMNKVGVIVEFQTYNLASSDNQGKSDRHAYVACLTANKRNNEFTDDTPSSAAYLVSEMEQMLQGLIAGASTKKMDVASNILDIPTDPKPYYEIVNIYMIPAEWSQNIVNQYTTGPTFTVGIDIATTSSAARVTELAFWTFCERVSPSDPSLGYSYPTGRWKNFLAVELPNNYMNLSVGPYTNPIPLSNNGLDKTILFRVSIDGMSFNLTMNMDGQIYDITPFYSLEVPFTSIDAETAQLRRIADREKRNNAIAKITGSTISFLGDTTKQIGGMSPGSPESVVVKGVGTMVSNAGDLTTDIWTGINAIQAASAAKYQTTYSQNIDVVGAVNAYYGITLFRLDLPYNEEEVEYAINNVGYTTAIIIPSSNKPWNPLNVSPSVGYNPIRYHYINLYGKAPQNVVKQLEQILTRGTKVYYS